MQNCIPAMVNTHPGTRMAGLTNERYSKVGNRTMLTPDLKIIKNLPKETE
jgi:hypothetical protein